MRRWMPPRRLGGNALPSWGRIWLASPAGVGHKPGERSQAGREPPARLWRLPTGGLGLRAGPALRGGRIPGIARADRAGAAARRRPPRVDLIDGLAARDWVLGEPAAGVPNSLDAPPPRST